MGVRDFDNQASKSAMEACLEQPSAAPAAIDETFSQLQRIVEKNVVHSHSFYKKKRRHVSCAISPVVSDHRVCPSGLPNPGKIGLLIFEI